MYIKTDQFFRIKRIEFEKAGWISKLLVKELFSDTFWSTLSRKLFRYLSIFMCLFKPTPLFI